MKRPLQASLATAVVVSVAVVAPLVAHAASSTTPAACVVQQHAVNSAQDKVDKDIASLVTASRSRHHASSARAARKQLHHAQSTLDTAQDALTACSVANKPGPSVTTTATATATATATTTATVSPRPLTFNQGTAVLNETQSDLSAIPAISYWDGVPIGGTGFGSSWTADPNNPGYFYGLTDRGPNVSSPGGNKLEPMNGFQDQIGYFHQVSGTMELVRTIGLTLPDGTAMSGLVNTEATTGETIIDQYGDTLPKAKSGLDTEGLVALKDGSFWVSDEYGPFVVHFSPAGKEIGRLDPYQAASTAGYFGDQTNALPAELKKRLPNRGMEGLTLSSDGKYLVGIMQSSLDKNGGAGTTAIASAAGSITRIVKIDLSDLTKVQEYLYYLHGNAGNSLKEAVSEITAVPGGSGLQFLVDERDGKFEGTAGNATKNLWKIDLGSATDVGPASPLIGTTQAGGSVTYDAAAGLEVGGKTIEDLAGNQSGSAASTALGGNGINTASEGLFLNYAGLLTSIDPTGMYFGHDKVEGVSVDAANPNILYIANDSDFGITDLKGTADPSPTDGDNRAKGTSAEKFLPDNKTQDSGEVLEVDMTKVPAAYRG